MSTTDTSGHQPTVLVVEDDEPTRAAMVAVPAGEGFPQGGLYLTEWATI